MVPSVHVAVASPFAFVNATRGLVAPLPDVTAKATAALATGFPLASVTFTPSALGIDEPTAAVRVSRPVGSSFEGFIADGETPSFTHAAARAASARRSVRRKERERMYAGRRPEAAIKRYRATAAGVRLKDYPASLRATRFTRLRQARPTLREHTR